MAIQDSLETRTATMEEERRVIDTLVLAFTSDPFIRWFYPSPTDYIRYFPEFIRVYGGKAFDHGTAHYLRDFAAAALWLPPDVRPDEDDFIALLQTSLSDERREHAFSVVAQLDAYHPREPFWHLPLIGVDSTQQRHGYGSALMTYALERCDREGTLAYLESSNPMNISLYARHGFEILGMIQEGPMPPLIPMLREPQN